MSIVIQSLLRCVFPDVRDCQNRMVGATGLPARSRCSDVSSPYFGEAAAPFFETLASFERMRHAGETEVGKAVIKILRGWLAARRLTGGASARYRLAGRTAGTLERADAEAIAGWFFDADRCGEILPIEIFVDGIRVDSACTCVERPDLDHLFGVGGARGFHVSPAFLLEPCDREQEVTIHLAGKMSSFVGPVRLAPRGFLPDYGGRHLFAHVTASAEGIRRHFDARSIEAQHSEEQRLARVEAKLQHVFDHVTATHERIFNKLGEMSSTTNATLPFPARSRLSGVGAFADEELDDDVEQDLFKQKLETAILGTRLAS